MLGQLIQPSLHYHHRVVWIAEEIEWTGGKGDETEGGDESRWGRWSIHVFFSESCTCTRFIRSILLVRLAATCRHKTSQRAQSIERYLLSFTLFFFPHKALFDLFFSHIRCFKPQNEILFHIDIYSTVGAALFWLPSSFCNCSHCFCCQHTLNYLYFYDLITALTTPLL